MRGDFRATHRFIQILLQCRRRQRLAPAQPRAAARPQPLQTRRRGTRGMVRDNDAHAPPLHASCTTVLQGAIKCRWLAPTATAKPCSSCPGSRCATSICSTRRHATGRFAPGRNGHDWDGMGMSRTYDLVSTRHHSTVINDESVGGKQRDRHVKLNPVAVVAARVAPATPWPRPRPQPRDRLVHKHRARECRRTKE